MKTVLEFENEEEYLKWESIRGNEITTIQDSDGIIIGELKEQDLLTLSNLGRIVSFDNPKGFVEETFIAINFAPIVANWGIVDDNDKTVLDKLVHIKILA
tara:strand:- start:5264 stop:5563 length:300 start_codon:yes stop_codon:yes gene_type:complete